jgi:hypothetical protein
MVSKYALTYYLSGGGSREVTAEKEKMDPLARRERAGRDRQCNDIEEEARSV